MTDLQTLELLAKAEAEAKRRLSAAEEAASRTKIDAAKEAEVVLKNAKDQASSFKDARMRQVRAEVEAASAAALKARQAELEAKHPKTGSKVKDHAAELLPRFEKWLESREVGKR